MKNLEAKTVVTEDRYAYMGAETFKEFLEIYPYENSDAWAETLLKWLIFAYVDDWETLRHFVLIPHRLCWNDNKIAIYEDDITLDFVYEIDNGRGDRYCVGDNSATLNYECWRDRDDTICWISWYWLGDDIPEPLFVDRANMTENDKYEWERTFYMTTLIVWKVANNGKTAGEETIEPTFCRQDALDAILEWAERNADKLQ